MKAALRFVDFQHTICGFAVVYGHCSVAQISIAISGKNGFPIVYQPKSDFGIAQSKTGDHFVDRSIFVGGFFEKRLTRRHVIKQIAHDDGGTLRTACAFQGYYRTAFHQGPHSLLRTFGSRLHFYLGNGRNRWKRFAAKTQRAQSEQIIALRNFAGRMVLEGEAHFSRGNSAAVVRNSEVRDPPFAQFNGNRSRASVQGIFHQFFGDG